MRAVDETWVRRRRRMDTQTLFSLLSRAAAGTRSVRAAVEQVCRERGSPAARVAASSVSRALRRLPARSFDVVRARMLRRFAAPARRRVLAVDGSKVHVPPSLMKEGYCTQRIRLGARARPRPLALLTCVLDVNSRLPVAWSVRNDSNERQAIMSLLPQLHRGDVLVCDRGYFSHALVAAARRFGLHVVLRLRRNADKHVKAWIAGGAATSAHPLLGGKLFSYCAQSSRFFCFSTCTDTPDGTLRDWYRQRWAVESFFKTMKSDLCLRGIRCRTSAVMQHYVGARVLLYALAALLHPPPPPRWLLHHRGQTVHRKGRRKHMGILRIALGLLPRVCCLTMRGCGGRTVADTLIPQSECTDWWGIQRRSKQSPVLPTSQPLPTSVSPSPFWDTVQQ